MNIKITVTADGSHTLVNSQLDESYHTLHGALTESIHVYINAGLLPLSTIKPRIRILEVGFGTGLNVLLTAQKARQLGLLVELTTLEPFPLPAAITARLNYDQGLAELGDYGHEEELRALFDALHAAPWDATSELGGLTLTKICGKLEQQTFAPGSFDLVYFDAFAPKKQPELWACDNFSKLYAWMAAESLLVTYCANGQFKRDLRGVAFGVEGFPGPLGRREMTRAWKGLAPIIVSATDNAQATDGADISKNTISS